MPSTSIRDHLAAALHADRDHTRDGVQLGSEPICNCYTLADVAVAALGGPLVLRPGDVIALRNRERKISTQEAAGIAAELQRVGVTAILLGPEWAIERNSSEAAALQPSIAQSTERQP